MTVAFPDGGVYYRFLSRAARAPVQVTADWCYTAGTIWGDMLLSGGDLYLKDPGQHLSGSVLFDPAVAGGSTVQETKGETGGTCLASLVNACDGFKEDQSIYIREEFDDPQTHENDPKDPSLKYCYRGHVIEAAALIKCNDKCKSRDCAKKHGTGYNCEPTTTPPQPTDLAPPKSKKGGKPEPPRSLLMYECTCKCAKPENGKTRFQRETERILAEMGRYAEGLMRKERDKGLGMSDDTLKSIDVDAGKAAADCWKVAEKVETPKGEAKKAR